MPVLAKGDQGVLTGVCQNGFELRDSVDDENTNEARPGAQLVAFPRRHLQCSSHVRNRDLVDPGALAASIEPASWHAACRGLARS